MCKSYLSNSLYINQTFPIFPEYGPSSGNKEECAFLSFIFISADILFVLGIFFFVPIGLLLKLDPMHHLLLQFVPYYSNTFSIQVWVGLIFRLPFSIVIALDVARCWVYIALFFVVGSKIWLYYFHLMEQPYRKEHCFALATFSKLTESISKYKEVLVLQKIYHYPLTTLPTLMMFFISLTVVLTNYFAVRMHHLMPGIILYFVIPAFLVVSLWLPFHTLPDCGEFNAVSVQLVRKWRLRASCVWGNVRRKQIDRALRSLQESHFHFGLGQYTFVNMTPRTKITYHKVIIEYTISALLFKWKG